MRWYAQDEVNQEDSEQNVVARTVVKAPKSPHITSILRSLHGLKINERIKYKLLSLTYKVLTTSQPDYTYTILSRFSLQVELAPRRLSPHPRSTIRIFLITNHQPLFHIWITLPVESAPFFIPSTSFCSLSSWFTSSCAYHLITVITFALITYHCLYISLQT